MSVSFFARLAARHNPVDPRQRRLFLKQSLATGAALLFSGSGRAFARPAWGAKRVVVIGGGFSGLTCAYELKALGYDITVIEATNRVGGRVLSFNAANKSEFIPGRNIEGGGELVGSNHPLWIAYAAKFGLEFLPMNESEMDFPIILGGKLITGEESAKLYEEMDAGLAKLNSLAEPIDADAPWKSPDAAKRDRETIADWLKGAELPDLCRSGIAAQLSGDNGVANDKASLLGMLTAIKGGGLEKYWTETETCRCKGGNDQLAAKLAADLGDRVITRLPVRSVEMKGDAAVVTCQDNRTLECDDVVLAVAPSAWKRIEFKPGLPSEIEPGRAVQMGTNVKYLTHVKSRFWQAGNLDPVGLTDDLCSWTWDSTDAQDESVEIAGEKNEDGTPKMNPNPADKVACLTGFAGGPSAEKLRAMSSDTRDAAVADLMEKLFPGFGENKVDRRFMDWPTAPYVQAGYSFPAPGQVTTAGPVLARGLGKLHFAGEHCCYKFVGYMEGALQSGVAVAKRLAVRDGVAK